MTFWLELDKSFVKSRISKFQDQQALILTDEEEPVGILRYQLFWDTIPLYPCWWSTNPSREKGRGRHFLRLWEAEMRETRVWDVWPLLSLMRAVSISIENVAAKMPVGCLWTYQVLNSRWNCFCEAVMIKKSSITLSSSELSSEFRFLFSLCEFVRMLKRIPIFCNRLIWKRFLFQWTPNFPIINLPIKSKGVSSMKEKVMDAMQKFSKAMFVPVLILPIAGILIAIGNVFTNVRLIERFPFWIIRSQLVLGVYYLLLPYRFWRISASYLCRDRSWSSQRKKAEAGFTAWLGYLVLLYAMNKFLELRGC